MSRTAKRKGTVPKGPPAPKTPRESILGQMLFEARNQLIAAQSDALVAKTMLAAVLTTVGDVEISPETIAELQGKPFTIEKQATAGGGLVVHSEVAPTVEAEVVELEVLNAENEGMV